MGVVWVREKYGNEADRDRENGRYRRTYLVKVADAQNDRELTIINDGLVQSKLRRWEAGGNVDTTTSLSRFTLRSLEEHPELYELAVEFEGELGVDDTGGGGGGSTDPLDEPPEFEYTFASRRKAIAAGFSDEGAASDNPRPEDIVKLRVKGVVNSAKQPFSEQPEIDDDRLVLLLTINQRFYSPRVAVHYANSVNSDQVSNAPPGTLLMKPWQARFQSKNGVSYWRVRYEIHYSEEGWSIKIVDEGSYYWKGGYDDPSEEPTYFKDKDGHPRTGLLVGNPVWNTATGAPRADGLKPGDKLPDGEQENYVVIERPNKLRNFGALNLPIPPQII